MRVSGGNIILVAVVMALFLAGKDTGGGVDAQFAVGPGGVGAPPINVLTVLRLLRRVFSGIATYPPDQPKYEDVCVDEDEAGECLKWEMREAEYEPEAQDKIIGTGSTQLLVGKWPLLYAGFITITSILILVIATPYFVTGETFVTRNFNINSLMHENYLEDSALLLSWLLSETGDGEDCLQKMVCDMPHKSSFYLDHIASLLHFMPRSWVPSRYEDQVRRLDKVRNEGYKHQCHKYQCSDLTF